MLTRRTRVEIIIEGKNVTADIKKYLKSVSYTDVLEGESDTAQISLHDEDRLFIGDWFPSRGDSCNIIFIREFWQDNIETLNLNDFEIDEITNTSSNSGNTASIKLNSIANKSQLRATNKSRSWENAKLSKIARDIADDAGMELFFDADDIDIKRAEQKEKSNLSFLYTICKDNGLALKCSDNKLIIFDVERYEQKDSVKTLSYGGGEIISFSGTATISKIYKACHVKYQHGKQAEKIDYTYSDDSKTEGLTIEVNKKVDSPAEAEKLAKKELRNKNKDEIKVQIKCIGDFVYQAGNNIQLEGYGFYDGKYIIDKAVHNIGDGYTVNLELHKCLKGY